MGKCEEKRPLRRPIYIYIYIYIKEYNVEMDLTERGREGVGWIYLLQGRGKWRTVVKTVTNLRFQ